MCFVARLSGLEGGGGEEGSVRETRIQILKQNEKTARKMCFLKSILQEEFKNKLNFP